MSWWAQHMLPNGLQKIPNRSNQTLRFQSELFKKFFPKYIIGVAHPRYLTWTDVMASQAVKINMIIFTMVLSRASMCVHLRASQTNMIVNKYYWQSLNEKTRATTSKERSHLSYCKSDVKKDIICNTLHHDRLGDKFAKDETLLSECVRFWLLSGILQIFSSIFVF